LNPEVVDFWRALYEAWRPSASPVTSPSPPPMALASAAPEATPTEIPTAIPVLGLESPEPTPSPEATPLVAPEAVLTDDGDDLEDLEVAPDPLGDTLPEGAKVLATAPDEKPPTVAPTPAAQSSSLARLRIEFEHSIKDGWLRIWIDKKRVLTERLKSTSGRSNLSFRTRKNQVRDSLRLAPGRHGVYVEVTWNANRKKAASSVMLQLRGGDNRALVILLDDEDLRLSLY
jgi:hypothetical protein